MVVCLFKIRGTKSVPIILDSITKFCKLLSCFVTERYMLKFFYYWFDPFFGIHSDICLHWWIVTFHGVDIFRMNIDVAFKILKCLSKMFQNGELSQPRHMVYVWLSDFKYYKQGFVYTTLIKINIHQRQQFLNGLINLKLFKMIVAASCHWNVSSDSHTHFLSIIYCMTKLMHARNWNPFGKYIYIRNILYQMAFK